jgi:signal peptidase II
MTWKFFLCDWGSLNAVLFQIVNQGTPASLEPVAWFFSLLDRTTGDGVQEI